MFEKEAEEYAKDCEKEFHTSYGACLHSFKDGAEFGYNRGLKAGRPKWHKVADGDLPKESVEVLNKDGDKVIYDAGGSQGWIAYSEYCGRYVEVDEPIAWCEIPDFEEEVKECRT